MPQLPQTHAQSVTHPPKTPRALPVCKIDEHLEHLTPTSAKPRTYKNRKMSASLPSMSASPPPPAIALSHRREGQKRRVDFDSRPEYRAVGRFHERFGH
jgi:hypothetical protein